MKYQFSICRSVSTFCIFAIFSFTLTAGGNPLAFIHIPSFLFPCGICFFMMLIVYGMEFLRFILRALQIFVCKPLESNPRFVQIALFGSRSVVGAGVIAMVIGLVQMLQNLSSPDQIGAGMAIALLSPFYAIILSEIFLAIIYQSFKDSADNTDQKATLPLANAALPLLIILLSVVTFSILMLSFTGYDSSMFNLSIS